MRTRTIRICHTLVSISEPMDAGKYVELVFHYPPCEHTEIVGGGEKRWRIAARDSGLWAVGDAFYEIQRRS